MGTLTTFLPYILLFILIVMMFTCLKGMRKGMGGCCTTVHRKDSSKNQNNSVNPSTTISAFQPIHLSELHAQMEVLEQQNRILMTEIETLKQKQKESSV